MVAQEGHEANVKQTSVNVVGVTVSSYLPSFNRNYHNNFLNVCDDTALPCSRHLPLMRATVDSHFSSPSLSSWAWFPRNRCYESATHEIYEELGEAIARDWKKRNRRSSRKLSRFCLQYCCCREAILATTLTGTINSPPEEQKLHSFLVDFDISSIYIQARKFGAFGGEELSKPKHTQKISFVKRKLDRTHCKPCQA